MEDNNTIAIPKANIYVYWFTAIIIFGFFDGMILGSKWPFLANVRTILYLTLFFVTFLKYKFRNIYKNIWLNLFLFYLIFVGIIKYDEYATYDYLGLNYLLKNIFQILLLYCFLNYEQLTGRNIESLFPTILRVAAIWCVLNFLFYFVDFPIWGPQRHLWWGRIACGYPTVDVISLNFAFIILLFSKVPIGSLLKLGMAVLFVISIMAQASGTGSFVLFCSLVAYIYQIVFKNGFNFKRFILSIISIIVILFSLSYASSVYKNYDSAMYDDAITILTDKFYGITGQNDKITTYDTMDMRNEVAERSMKDLKSIDEKLFGLGFANLDYSEGRSALSSKYVMIENQYKINLYTVGYIGNILFILAVYLGLIYIVRYKIEGSFFICILFLMYALSGMTTTTFVSFPIQVVFGIIYTLQEKYRFRI